MEEAVEKVSEATDLCKAVVLGRRLPLMGNACLIIRLQNSLCVIPKYVRVYSHNILFQILQIFTDSVRHWMSPFDQVHLGNPSHPITGARQELYDERSTTTSL